MRTATTRRVGSLATMERTTTRGRSRAGVAREAASSTRATGSEVRVEDLFPEGERRGIILYDGVCNLCNGAVNFAIANDGNGGRGGSVRFAALQSETGRRLLRNAGRDAEDISSIVFVEAANSEASYVKSEAVLRIAKRMRAPFPQLAAIGSVFPRALGDLAYDLVADNRYFILGRRDECRLGDDVHDDRFLR